MGKEVAHPDLEIAETARRQHGVITRAQLRAAGLGDAAIGKRVGRGRLHRIHRGVYAVGHAGLSSRGRWMAAVLACGDRAVLSHAAAAALWGLLRPIPGPIDVSVPTNSGRTRRSVIRLHRCPSLASEGHGKATTRRDGIPVTTPARTVADLHLVVEPRLVRRARRQAELVGLLGPGAESDRTRSDLERAFLRLCRRHRLPAPEVNVKLGRWTVDFLWRGSRLVVETDSYLYHRGSVAFREDRARDLGLRELGYDVLRFSERQIEEEPERVAADVATVLRGGPGTGGAVHRAP